MTNGISLRSLLKALSAGWASFADDGYASMDNYRPPVNIDLSCCGQNKKQVRTQFQDAAANVNYRQANREELTIDFTNHDQVLPLNSWLKFNWLDLPELRAAPVMSNKKVLIGGTFGAIATLLADNQ
jgi:hypothetical protein